MILAQNLLQCCSRSLLMCFYAFWSPETWTLNLETQFFIYRPLKIGSRPIKSATDARKNASRMHQIGARFASIGARFFQQVCSYKSAPDFAVSGPDFSSLLVAWNLWFLVLSAWISWWITLKIHEKVSTKLVMTESHHCYIIKLQTRS